jgi:cytochrome o ubiquinol oxidase subunit 1
MFLVAHFHNVIIGAVVFGVMAGYTYWFPKAFGFTLDERLGKIIFWCWFIGFYLAWMPGYALGFMGATRRLQHITDPSWAPYLHVEMLGALVILAGIVLTVVQLLYSIRTRDQRRDLTGDPWDGRTLEWLTLSPPPHFNFAVLPDVHGEEAYWTRKLAAIREEKLSEEPKYEDIEMPLNTPTGVICAFFTSVTGFAVIWYIWWLAILGLIGAFAVLVWYAWRDEHEHVIPAAEVAELERERRRIRAELLKTLTVPA